MIERLLRRFRRTLNGEGVHGNGVVVVTRPDLFPTDHGAAVKIIETARALAAQGRPVAIVTSDRQRCWVVDDSKIHEHRLPIWLRALAPPGRLTLLWHLLRGWPASNAFLYLALWDPFYGLRAAWAGRRIGAGVYLAEFPAYARAALLARDLNGGRVVMVEHNVEYQRIAELAPRLRAVQYQRLKQRELELIAACDTVVCVSDDDRQQLIADGAPAERLTVIPHGVDVAALARARPADIVSDFGLDRQLPVLVYHGIYRYGPNLEAIRILAEEILPRLEQAGHPAQVLAIGSDPPPRPPHKRIFFTGSLEQLGPALRAAHIAVVPLVQGGGTRMKILDYFAAGAPVVSTRKGCEGIPVTDGLELLIRDNWDGFAAAIVTLLEEPSLRTSLAHSARKIADDLDWSAIGQRYDELFNHLPNDLERTDIAQVPEQRLARSDRNISPRS